MVKVCVFVAAREHSEFPFPWSTPSGRVFHLECEASFFIRTEDVIAAHSAARSLQPGGRQWYMVWTALPVHVLSRWFCFNKDYLWWHRAQNVMMLQYMVAGATESMEIETRNSSCERKKNQLMQFFSSVVFLSPVCVYSTLSCGNYLWWVYLTRSCKRSGSVPCARTVVHALSACAAYCSTESGKL